MTRISCATRLARSHVHAAPGGLSRSRVANAERTVGVHAPPRESAGALMAPRRSNSAHLHRPWRATWRELVLRRGAGRAGQFAHVRQGAASKVTEPVFWPPAGVQR